MRKSCKSGSVGEAAGDRRLYPTTWYPPVVLIGMARAHRTYPGAGSGPRVESCPCLRGRSDRFAPIKVVRHGRCTARKRPSGAADPRRGAFGNETGPNATPRRMLVVVGYRIGMITSFPLGKPVLSSSTTAGIASDSGTMRAIAATSWPRSAASAIPAKDCGVGLPNAS